MENNEILALIGLMDEPDEAIYLKVREQLLNSGADAIPLLETAWENTFDVSLQQRIEEIIHLIQFNQLKFELNNWRVFQSNDLLKAYLLITRYQYPEINEEEITANIEQFKWDIWLELNENLTALEVVKVVNHVVYDIHKYGANKANPNTLQNYFLNTLLENQRGNPLSLGILYLILTGRLHLPVYGVDLPDHFILAYTNDLRLGETLVRSENSQVLFYINPFKKGAVFTAKEIDNYLLQSKLEPKIDYFIPCDTITIIKRLVENLILTYKYYNLDDKVTELEELREILE
ncbi:MAG: hypothetical protein NTU44_19595 [Bacteroidetes bacterium]|nr:hypothetical protein [Bacteroidota bacterium]